MTTRVWNWLFIVAVIAAALAWLVNGWLGLTSYRPVYRETSAPGAPLPALASKVVFVIIDGLRYDLAQRMPCLQQLRSNGAFAPSIAALPSFSQATWTTLVTGADPEISGVSLLNADYEEIQPISVTHLFQVAKQAGLTTALAGEAWWGKMVPAQYVDHWYLVETFDARGDLASAQAALEWVRDPNIDLTLLYLGDYDEISHEYGALSPEALQSAKNIDQHLCSLLSAVDLSGTVLIVTSDHGQLAVAGHGGDEQEAVTSPLVIAGPRVRRGIYSAICQADIPATISALLGLSLPTSGQGQIRYEFLDVTEAEKAQGLAIQVAQQMALADAYLPAIKAPALPGELRAQAAELNRLLQDSSFGEASRAGEALLKQVRDDAGQARASRLSQSRWPMLPVALLGLGLIGCLLVSNVRAIGWAPLLLAVVGVGAYHGFYLLLGQSYSLSTLSRVGSPVSFSIGVLGGAIIALGLGLGVLWLVSRMGWTRGTRRQSEPRARSRPAAAWMPALCADLLGLLFAPALVAWVVSGRVGNWTLSVPGASFLLMLSLLQAAITGLLAIITLSIAAAVSRLRRSARPSA